MSHGFFCKSPSHLDHVCRKRDLEPNRTCLSFKDRNSSPSHPRTGLWPLSLAGCSSPCHSPPGGLDCHLHIPSLFELCLLRLVTTTLPGTVSSGIILPVPSEGSLPLPPDQTGMLSFLVGPPVSSLVLSYSIHTSGSQSVSLGAAASLAPGDLLETRPTE